MLRSMNSAITALSLHQAYMDVVANNLANVNTTAYKTSRVDFKTQISQPQAIGSAPTAANATPSLGGQNPMQIGLGVELGAITKVMTQGAMKTTGRALDLAVQGDGFFIVDDGTQTHAFSRDGALDVGQDNVVTQLATGLHVLGWNVNATTGLVDTTGPITALTAPGTAGQARATTSATLGGNLNSQAAAAATVDTTVAIYDALGTQHNITIRLTHGAVGSNTWTPSVVAPAAGWNPPFTGAPTLAGGNLTFDGNGQLLTPLPGAFTMTATLNNGAQVAPAVSPQVIALDVADLTQLATTSSVSQVSQDGLAPGNINGLVVSDTGQVMASYTNGISRQVGQVALANFTNPEGLLAAGQNLYRPWLNSGTPQIGTPGNNTFGVIASGRLESSNVDLAQEFTNMITAQRGFQSNSRVITTSDEMLQELISMKR